MASETGIAGTLKKDTEVRLPRTTRVKDKQPADKQITAEQILREAKELQLEDEFKPPVQIITDTAELDEYRLRKRKEFEDLLRRVGRFNMNVWVKYAQWEESQKDFRRARSVWERTLQISYTNVSIWLKYAEMEMRNRFINHARNVWDRAVTYLPRVDQLWYKYVHMEEMLGNVAGSRAIFDRWMRFEPDHQGWAAYINFELRYNEVARARAIYERYVQVLPSVKAWVRYAKFEMKNGEIALARQTYERAVEALGEDGETEELFMKFAEFEEKVKETERSRAIYKYALDHLPKSQASRLYERYLAFEKQHGEREGIEQAILSKRRFYYEEQVQANPLNYDAWFDYARLEGSAEDVERVRDVYERAIANKPPANEKWFWKRYIYLWINYALFEELDVGDMGRARDVYYMCLKVIPHEQFTFAKIWILAAQFEIRQKQLDAARKILGMAIGMAPKEKVFKTYIEIELMLGNIDRCRTLYKKYLEWNPENCSAWCRYAELECGLEEDERARAIYELAISQAVLDMPELLWKAYIDFEIEKGSRARTRVLYERLLDRTKHVRVWMSYAQFEASPLPNAGDDEELEQGDEESAKSREECAEKVYERAFQCLRELQPDAKEEAVLLLEAWRAFEQESTSKSAEEKAKSVETVEKKMPKKVKRKRSIVTEDQLEAGFEEYYDYIFPEEGGHAPNLRLLEMARRWKQQKQTK
ncbi:unnamed protein product [Ostreobium quekettii]|uniref:Crooked neck protein n=1 Tax=Ostreobium quekettii TaxID=121088 RepID=A0A8S1IV71_9CHLO|nr:unnamed protein product [Ostreobium quekettii]